MEASRHSEGQGVDGLFKSRESVVGGCRMQHADVPHICNRDIPVQQHPDSLWHSLTGSHRAAWTGTSLSESEGSTPQTQLVLSLGQSTSRSGLVQVLVFKRWGVYIGPVSPCGTPVSRPLWGWLVYLAVNQHNNSLVSCKQNEPSCSAAAPPFVVGICWLWCFGELFTLTP